MKKIRLTPIIGVLGLATCVVVFVGDLQVQWTVDDSTSASTCSDYGIDKWQINLSELPGRRLVDDLTIVCGDAWETGNLFYGMEEGEYEVEMAALDGGGNEIASKIKEILLVDDGSTIWTVSFRFTAADFGGGGPECGDGKCEGDENSTCPEDCPPPADASLLVSWKINGTVDGTATGASYDTCAEVGATQVALTLEGETTVFPCEANDQSVEITGLVAGDYAVEIALQDDSGDITTKASDTLTASQTPAEEPFEFYFDSFIEPIKSSITGDYLFMSLFEAAMLKCSQTNPQVAQQVMLLQLDGTPVAGEFCRATGGSCTPLNNNDFGICMEDPQAIEGLIWGSYKLAIQGFPSGKTTVCWETVHPSDGTKFVDILVGAGIENPVIDMVLDRVDTAGDCAPQ